MALAHAIMTALIDDEMSGYELARSFDNSLGFFWQASHQQIYQELRKLSQKKWLKRREVSQQGKPDKISYRLTRSGRRALDKWVYGESRHSLAKDELLLKLCNLTEENRPHITAEIARRREAMMRRLYLYEKVHRGLYAEPEALPLRRQGIYLALLNGIRQGEQFLSWCDEAVELLAAKSD